MNSPDQAQTLFRVDGSKPVIVAVPDGFAVQLTNAGNATVYHGDGSVTSDSNDGDVPAGGTHTLTSTRFLVAGQHTETRILAVTTEAD